MDSKKNQDKHPGRDAPWPQACLPHNRLGKRLLFLMEPRFPQQGFKIAQARFPA